jgi:hypothetical protein
MAARPISVFPDVDARPACDGGQQGGLARSILAYEQGHWPIDGYGLGLLEERQVKWIRLARGEAIVNDGQARQMHRHSF